MSHETEQRLTRLESALESIPGTLEKIHESLSDLTKATNKIAAIEEKQHGYSKAIDRAFLAIEKNTEAIAKLRDHTSKHDTWSHEKLAELSKAMTTAVDASSKEQSLAHGVVVEKVDHLENEIIAKVSWAKGAWFSASFLWGIIQVGIVGAIGWVYAVINENHDKILVLEQITEGIK